MTTKIIEFVFFLLTIFLFDASNAAKYLTQKPSFMKPCQLSDSNFNKCFARNFQGLFYEWKDGVPGLNSVGSFDPLHVKRIKFSQDASTNGLQINADLKNVNVRGISGAQIKDASFDPARFISKFAISVPKLRFDFDYKVKGKLLSLNLNSQGKGFFESENSVIFITIHMKRRAERTATFTDVESIRIEFRQIAAFRIRLDNLFNGQKELEDSTNELFNTNWREFYAIMRPAVEQTVEAVLLDRFKKTFAYVPASYFIENLR